MKSEEAMTSPEERGMIYRVCNSTVVITRIMFPIIIIAVLSSNGCNINITTARNDSNIAFTLTSCDTTIVHVTS